jgi:hypothetical protein
MEKFWDLKRRYRPLRDPGVIKENSESWLASRNCRLDLGSRNEELQV